MTPAEQHQLRALDRAILDLVDERLRLLREVAAPPPAGVAALEDLLRRHTGGFPAAGVRELFEVIDRHSQAGRP
jgi:hypothetical protein